MSLLLGFVNDDDEEGDEAVGNDSTYSSTEPTLKEQLAPGGRTTTAGGPSICVTGVMLQDGNFTVTRRQHPEAEIVEFGLHYTVFRPRQLKQDKFVWSPPPLVVLHGGPGIPSTYQLSLVNVVTDRAIIFYDQLGCGRSSRPTDELWFSIETHVADLEVLVARLIPPDRGFSLYGHSFGGILAYEYLKKQRRKAASEDSSLQPTANTCQSVILSSVPTETAVVEQESQRLLEQIQEENPTFTKRETLQHFRKIHECRQFDPLPLALQDAHRQAAKVWRGIGAISSYRAELGTENKRRVRVPCLTMRGQHDFVTHKCVKDWNRCFKFCDTMTLAGCSHHGLLENESLYGDVVEAFLQEHDPPKQMS